MFDQRALVLRDDAGAVATLTLHRPEKLNALSPQLFVQLREHIDAVAADPSVSCVVLTGAGRSFCAGLDLTTVGTDPDFKDFAGATIDALEALPQPTIGKIRGHCLTGGLELALACDMLVSANAASFGDTHGRWSLVPVWGLSVRLPERIGAPRAKELMLAGRRLSGPEAEACGLVIRSVPDDELDEAVGAIAAGVLANSLASNRINKLLVAAGQGLGHLEALAFERTRPFGRPVDADARVAEFGRAENGRAE